MALTRRGSTAPVAGGSTTSPSGTQIGDLVVVYTWERLGAASGTTLTIVSGYTEINNWFHNDGSTDGALAVGYKVATASGAQSYQAFTSSTGTPTWWTGCIVFNVGTFDVGTLPPSAGVTLTTSGVPNPPQVTGLDASATYGILAISAWHLGSSLTLTPTAPTGYTLRGDVSGAATGDVACSDRNTLLTGATSEDPASYGDDQTPNGSCSITVAIKDAFWTKQSADIITVLLQGANAETWIGDGSALRVALREATVLDTGGGPTVVGGTDLLALRLGDDASAVLTVLLIADPLGLRLGDAQVSISGIATAADALGMRLLDDTPILVVLSLGTDVVALALVAGAVDTAIDLDAPLRLALLDAASVQTTGGGPDQILGTDVLGLRLDDEAVVVLVAVAPTDPLALRLIEAASLSGVMQTDDRLALRLDEGLALLLTVADQERLGLRLDDDTALLAIVLTGDDPLAVRLDDVSTVLGLATVVDVLGLRLAEAQALDAILAQADVLALRVVELAGDVQVVLVTPDPLGLRIDEDGQVATFAFLLDTDVLGLGLGETSVLALHVVMQDVDQVALRLDDLALVIGSAVVQAADVAGTALAEGAEGVLVAVVPTDVTGARLAEAGLILVSATAGDLLPLALLDQAIAFLQVMAADDARLALLDERTDLGQVSFLVAAEALGLTLAELAGVTYALVGLEALGVRLEALASLEGALQDADVVAARLGEAQTLAVATQMAEALGLTLEEAQTMLGFLADVERLGVGLREAVAFVALVQDVEALRLALLDAAPAVLALFPLLADDTLAFRLDEVAAILAATAQAQGAVLVATVGVPVIRATAVGPAATAVEVPMIQTTATGAAIAYSATAGTEHTIERR